MKKKIFFNLIIAAVCAVSGFAKIPGVKPYIDDRSGTFVYYKDSSFTRPSYIGFLYYDDSSFGIRYYAPATDTQLPKDISLLFTVDPEADHVNMTGERILSNVTQEDTELINYLHDLVYEFSSRRKKAGNIAPGAKDLPYKSSDIFMNNGFESSESFMQFGGKVTVVYDYLVPVFNIKKIYGPDAVNVFELCSIGSVSNSQAKAFFEFVPVELLTPAKEAALPEIKPGKLRDVKLPLWSFKIDDNFTEHSASLYLMDSNAAFLFAPTPATYKREEIIRMLLTSKDTDLKTLKISTDKSGKTKIEKINITKDSRYFDQKILMQSKELKQKGLILCVSLTVLEKFYKDNKSYFEKLLNSVK